MKTLTLVRHAKSSWDFPELPDRERPLNNRGMKDCTLMARIMQKSGWHFDAVYSSPATRALEAAQALTDAWHCHELLEVDARLYTFSANELLSFIKGLSSGSRVALFTHNPAITEVANQLSGCQFENIPTLGMVRMQFSTDNWVEVSRSPVKLLSFDCPKNYK